MKLQNILLTATLSSALLATGQVLAADNELTDQEKSDGYTLLFDGKTLDNWQFLPQFWSVQDGTIAGKTTKETPTKHNTFAISKAGEFGDFELHAQFKQTPGDEKGFSNSGIQYRSKVADPEKCIVGGYQADMENGKSYTGILYEERGRGILATRGQKVVLKDDEATKKLKKEVVGSVGDAAEIEANIKHGDWNDYVIIAKGNHLQQFINGKQTIDVTDETAIGAKSGIIALQLHAGSPMNVWFKNIKIKPLK